ncbi:hypothetical protein ACIQM0_30675 [Streptomyces sp. NPDC091387]|uniref:hypothetical protein n=1 Tax=Streptomyces sp. NPDC091387 TaxID=3365998 RepID=UPI00382B140C
MAASVLGAFTGMHVAGRLADPLGARAVIPAGAALCGAALVLPGLAREPWKNNAFLLLTPLCSTAAVTAGVLRTGSGRTRELASSSH